MGIYVVQIRKGLLIRRYFQIALLLIFSPRQILLLSDSNRAAVYCNRERHELLLHCCGSSRGMPYLIISVIMRSCLVQNNFSLGRLMGILSYFAGNA